MINTVEEYVQFLQGETTALRALVGALIDAHPDKAAIARTLAYQRQLLAKASAEVPPSDLAALRCEQILDQWEDLLPRP